MVKVLSLLLLQQLAALGGCAATGRQSQLSATPTQSRSDPACLGTHKTAASGVMAPTRTGKLVPNDPRATLLTTEVFGKKYEYLVSKPQGRKPIGTVLLVHGFPDLAFGWRYQIPHLVEKGYQVVAPNMLGYAGTDNPANLNHFTSKSMSQDLDELARQIVGDQPIILGGHDWGAALAWRVAVWYPKRIKAIFNVCTPFFRPTPFYSPLEKLPNFNYQNQFIGADIESQFQNRSQLHNFLNAMYTWNNRDESGFDVKSGVHIEKLPQLKHTTLLSEEELQYYVEQFMRQKAPSLHGPLNWYRTGVMNWHEELPLVSKNVTLTLPTLFIAAANDTSLPPLMSYGMESAVPNLTRATVNSGHWALAEASEDVNKHICDWLQKLSGGR